MRIGLFIPCYIDAFFPEVGIATLELLERFGHDVEYPRDQTCCGQPMANSGFNAECADTEALFVRNFSGFDYAIVGASLAVAEAGSVQLGDADLRLNAVAHLAQHLIVLLDPSDIVVNLHHAYRRAEFRDRQYASFHTRSSATANIEGVLIHGTHCVRALSVLPRAQPSGAPNH